MIGKILPLLAGMLFCTGCAWFEKDDPVPEPTPSSQLKATAPATVKKTKPAQPPKPAPKPTGLDAELNDVERAYVHDVKDRNARSVRANEEKVFGAFSPANFFPEQN